ncbi:flagellar hook protein FlgE [Methylorubrum sp. SB2]|uniref:flagellar hook protein FlgE n=1 Tax=Methylorubrum subtropicum TaxID=3138812 RepID=UPI00313D1C3A
MSLIGVLRTGVSGMNAQSNRISTVAENIQNAGTTGYKRTSTEFSSLLIEGNDQGQYNSGAVETTVRRSIGQDGPVTSTTSDSDLAISGKGFFVVKDGAGAPFLTRAGNFVIDGPTGNLVNAGGFTLQGYSLANGEPNPVLNGIADLEPINVSSLGMQARPTLSGTVDGNLSFETPVSTGPVSKKSSLKVFDNVGQAKILDVNMTKTGTNTWTVSFADQDAPATTLATTTLTFDANGKVASGGSATLTVPNGRVMTIDLSSMTQLSGNTGLSGTADGSAPTAVTGTAFGSDGTVYATFADGTRKAAFKVPLANVASPDNLSPRAGNVFIPSVDSGDIQVGFAGENGRGAIKSKALEQSNVDVSTELTTMIESQTVYTANSKVFMTGNEMLETLMNLKR